MPEPSPYEANYRQTRLQVQGFGYPTVIMTVGTPRHLPALLDRAVELGTSQRIRTRLVSVMECAASAIQLSSLVVHEMLTEELQCDVFIDNPIITDEIVSYESEENVRAHVLHMLRTNMCILQAFLVVGGERMDMNIFPRFMQDGVPLPTADVHAPIPPPPADVYAPIYDHSHDPMLDLTAEIDEQSGGIVMCARMCCEEIPER